MAVIIAGVQPGSRADVHGIRPGDLLLELNGHPIADVLDYRFYLTEPRLSVKLLQNGQEQTIHITKHRYDDIGLEFETYLMDQQHSCTNRCIFCFVDQLPKGLRSSLYFKDDDSRLSFLFGNYITLTNMSEADIDRICRMHISPINVSVHTTNPELRVKMMGNRFAGEKLRFLKKLADAGIALNTQLVLCPGINDGPELERSLRELSALYPAVQSIAMVPLGITAHREGLYPLRPYTAEEAAAVIDMADAFSREFCREGNPRIAYPADEFYIKAHRPIPDADFYGPFDQLENGVGMIALQKREAEDAVAELLEDSSLPAVQSPDSLTRCCSIACGTDIAPYLKNIVDFLREKWHNLHCEIIPVVNRFFGETITVTGLLTGRDLLAQLHGAPLGDELLLSSVMVRKEDELFLDDVSLEEVRAQLPVPIRLTRGGGEALVRAILGLPEQ